MIKGIRNKTVHIRRKILMKNFEQEKGTEKHFNFAWKQRKSEHKLKIIKKKVQGGSKQNVCFWQTFSGKTRW